MRGILLYILFFLGLSVAGCRGGRSYDSRLVAADSLVASQPDSALRLLSGVGFDSMGSDADRAYFALLLTQAKYKCDEIITSTDTIDIAVDYFSGGGDADKRLRSLIYRGAALADMGEITAAMEAYKQAEAAASPDDYENLGYINLRMASLYQKVYSDGREYIDKYRKALHYYELCGNKHYQIVCTSRLGAVYRLDKMDSAYYFINKSIELAKSEKDSAWIFCNYELLARAYWADSLYQKQKDISLYIFRNGRKFVTRHCLYDLSIAYSELNMPDSAEYYLNFLPKNCEDKADSVMRLMALTKIAVSKSNYKDAFTYKSIYSAISDSITKSQLGARIAKVESSFELEKSHLEKEINKRNTIIYVIISLFFFIVLIIIIIAQINRIKQNRLDYLSLISDLETELKEAEQINLTIKSKIENLENENKIIKSEKKNDAINLIRNAFETQVEKIKLIISTIDKNPLEKADKLKNKIDKVFAQNDLNELRYLQDYVNLIHSNALERLKEEFPILKEDELTLITLIYCGYSNSFIAIYMNYSSKQYVINRRLRIAAKMGIKESLQDFLRTY